MNTISANIAARRAFTDAVASRVKPPLTATQATDALFGWVYKQPGMATKEDCNAILRRVYFERGEDDSRALLQRFGIAGSDIDKLWIGQYQAFFEYARTCLQYGISPTFGWTSADDLPVEKRDRWLLSHPESDCVYEVRGEIPSELTTGLGDVVDVSGIDEYEKWFAASECYRTTWVIRKEEL